MKKILLLLVVLFTTHFNAQTLDSSFDGDGVVTSTFSNTQSSESIIKAEMQADGKMVYLGNYYENNLIYGGLAGAYIARYNTDGTLDTSFNFCGFRFFKNDYLLTFNLFGPTPYFYDLKIQTDGKILVSENSNLLRLNIDGSFDNSFGLNGNVQVTYNNQNLIFRSIKIQPDNKIILKNSYNGDIIVRLNNDGSLDTSFDNDGILVLNFGSPIGFGEQINNIEFQPNGKIILDVNVFDWDCITCTTGHFYAIIARLNNDGSIDNSFATNGITSRLQLSYNTTGSQLLIQNDGKILVRSAFSNQLPVVRYNANGSLDTSFGSNGTIGYNGIIKTLPNGKLLILEHQILNLGNLNYKLVFDLFRLNNDGSIDNSFATNGQFTSHQLDAGVNNLFIKNNGSIVIPGTFIDYTNYTNDDSMLHRLSKIELSSDGLFQNSMVFNLKQNFNELNGTIVQASGKIIAFYDQKKLVRFNIDGSIDNTFGTNGIIDLSGTYSNKILQQPNGNFILFATNSTKIYRRNVNGILDTTFGNNGELNLPFFSFINKIELTNDNKLFILSTDYSYFIRKLNNNGTTDTSFVLNDFDTVLGNFGRFNFFDDNEGETSENMIIQSDNKIIIAVTLISSISNDVATGLIRLNPNGALDTSFGTNGKIVIQLNDYIIPKKMHLLENDNFVINYDTGHGNTKLIKYNNNGVLDTNFNNSSITNDTYNTNEVIVQPDFKILKSYNINNKFTIAKYNNINGTLDTTFGTNGFIETTIGSSSKINQLWLQNNNLLAAGTSFNDTNESLAFARYTNLTLGTLDFNDNVSSAMIYPNPIQLEATFDFDLKNNETISVEIVDIQGRTVQTVVKNQELSAGNHKQNVNLTNLSSGNYILKFSSATGSQSIKIVKK